MGINNSHAFSGGISMGSAGGGFDAKAFAKGSFGLFSDRRLCAELLYIYNGYPSYKTHTHALLPLLSYSGRRGGITIGPGLRFSRFFGEPALFESMLSFSGYFNFAVSEKAVIGISASNFDDFHAGNTGSYSLSINSVIKAKKNWSVVNSVSLLQGGSVALSSIFYGITYRGGFTLEW